jgi:hypothetical protein
MTQENKPILEPKFKKIRVSKKLTVLLISYFLVILIFFSMIFFGKNLSLYCFIASLCSTQICVLLGCITYITGQAKIDIEAEACFGSKAEIASSGFNIGNLFKKKDEGE